MNPESSQIFDIHAVINFGHDFVYFIPYIMYIKLKKKLICIYLLHAFIISHLLLYINLNRYKLYTYQLRLQTFMFYRYYMLTLIVISLSSVTLLMNSYFVIYYYFKRRLIEQLGLFYILISLLIYLSSVKKVVLIKQSPP